MERHPGAEEYGNQGYQLGDETFGKALIHSGNEAYQNNDVQSAHSFVKDNGIA
jgi:hypothetical protein